jgi:hypothetical protein
VAVTGVHALVYTSEPDAVRAIFRDVFGWEHVDLGDNWLIFKLPPAELGVHPSEGSTAHEVCVMCDDIDSTMSELRDKGVQFRGDPVKESFGITTTMLLPGGLEMLLYQPTHESPLDL